jgi:hypothetical protein
MALAVASTGVMWADAVVEVWVMGGRDTPGAAEGHGGMKPNLIPAFTSLRRSQHHASSTIFAAPLVPATLQHLAGCDTSNHDPKQLRTAEP